MPLVMEARGTVVNNSSIAAITAVPFQGMYNSSKSALSMITDILRLELAPFDVKVVEIMSGAVKTNFFNNQQVQGLPSTSLYLPIKDAIEGVSTGRDIPKQIDVDVYAGRVVGDVLQKSPSIRVWRGGLSTVMWFWTTFTWHGSSNWIITRVSKLNKLGQMTKAD